MEIVTISEATDVDFFFLDWSVSDWFHFVCFRYLLLSDIYM